MRLLLAWLLFPTVSKVRKAVWNFEMWLVESFE